MQKKVWSSDLDLSDGGNQPDFFAGIQLKRSIHEEQLLAYCLLMFAKEIILEEQLVALCLFQCSPAGKLPANAGNLDY
jgi:hypothetical protein